MKHYMKNKPNKTVLKPSAWLCIHALGVFACLTWLRSYMLLCLCACELSMLVSLCTLRACVLACLPCLLCLTVLRVYILAWCAHLSCLLYIAISKFKNVFISKNLFVLLHWIFFLHATVWFLYIPIWSTTFWNQFKGSCEVNNIKIILQVFAVLIARFVLVFINSTSMKNVTIPTI